jgi:hypothetical protein
MRCLVSSKLNLFSPWLGISTISIVIIRPGCYYCYMYTISWLLVFNFCDMRPTPGEDPTARSGHSENSFEGISGSAELGAYVHVIEV